MPLLDSPSRTAAVEQVLSSAGDHEERFDRVVRLARRLFGVSVVAVNLVDDREQTSLSQVGLSSPVRPVSDSLCAAAVAADGPLVLPDARIDPVYADHPAVTSEEPVVFYAGRPLRAHGEVVGTLCLADDKPHDLSDAEDRMFADLAQWIEQELATDQDRREAREVQRRLLPRREAHVPGLQVAGHCQPARTVGGDFYDWQVLDDELQVVVADVMGKGLVAAVIAAAVRTLMRSTSPYNSLEGSVTRTGTDTLDDLDDVGTFVTMFAVRIHPTTGEMTYVDAGHGLALVLGPEGAVRRLHSAGLPLGALPGESWTANSEMLAPGETLLVVSDGVLDAFPGLDEAMAAAAELAAAGGTADQVVRRVLRRVTELTTSDDITVIAVRREPV